MAARIAEQSKHSFLASHGAWAVGGDGARASLMIAEMSSGMKVVSSDCVSSRRPAASAIVLGAN